MRVVCLTFVRLAAQLSAQIPIFLARTLCLYVCLPCPASHSSHLLVFARLDPATHSRACKFVERCLPISAFPECAFRIGVSWQIRWGTAAPPAIPRILFADEADIRWPQIRTNSPIACGTDREWT